MTSAVSQTDSDGSKDLSDRRAFPDLKKVRWWIILFWVVLVGALLPFAASVGQKLQTAADIRGGQSAKVVQVLNDSFDLPFSDTLTLVLTGVPSPETDAGFEILDRVTNRLEASEAILGALSWQHAQDPVFLSESGEGTFVVVGLDTRVVPADHLFAGLSVLARDLEAQIQTVSPGAELKWTGAAAINVDLRDWGTKNATDAEILALPAIAILLVLTFGALAASSLPLLCGVVTIVVTSGIIAILAGIFPVSVMVLNIVTMVGLGVSIDYALISVSRFREELGSGASSEQAARTTAVHAGRTVGISAIAVVIGFAAILAAPVRELQSIALGGILVVIIAMAVSTTLLPVLLSCLGDRINKGRTLSARSSKPTTQIWDWWSGVIAKRPLAVMSVPVLLLMAMAIPATRINVALPDMEWLPATAPSIGALADLQGMGRGGFAQSIEVLLELPEGLEVTTAQGWESVARVSTLLTKDPDIAFVRGVTSGPWGAILSPAALPFMPPAFVQRYISSDRRIARLDIIPNSDLKPHELTLLARDIANWNLEDVAGPEVTVLIGGLPAYNAEYEDIVRTRFFPIVGLVALGTFLVLVFWFRSVFIPLKALVLNLLSVAAGFGAVVLVFQEGAGSTLVGLDGAAGAVLPILPILVFCIVFGLSMDYEIFLVSRFAEARRSGLDDDEALRVALSRTGSVITSAAAIMLVVFGAFVLGDFLPIKMLGFALVVTVLVDATLVRLCIGPALLKIGGRWNWWPGEGLNGSSA